MSNNTHNQKLSTASDLYNCAQALRAAFKAAHHGVSLANTGQIYIPAKRLRNLHKSVKEIVNAADEIGLISKDDLVKEQKWVGNRINTDKDNGGRIHMVAKSAKRTLHLNGTPEITRHFNDILLHIIDKAEPIHHLQCAYEIVSKMDGSRGSFHIVR